jgi:hypothetical protein
VVGFFIMGIRPVKCVLDGRRTPWRFGGYQPPKVASQPFGVSW